MHIERRKSKFKVGFALLKLKIRSSEVGLKVGLKVGKKVGFSSGPDSNKVNFEVMLKVHQID